MHVYIALFYLVNFIVPILRASRSNKVSSRLITTTSQACAKVLETLMMRGQILSSGHETICDEKAFLYHYGLTLTPSQYEFIVVYLFIPIDIICGLICFHAHAVHLCCKKVLRRERRYLQCFEKLEFSASTCYTINNEHIVDCSQPQD